MKHRVTKGHYGYLKHRKRGLLIRGLILLAGIIVLFLTGYLTLGTRNNWLTIFAVLTALPMAMQFATLFAILKYKGRPEEEYREIREITGNGVLDTEILVSNKNGKPIELPYAYFHENGIFLWTPDTKADIPASEEYLHNFLRLQEADGPVTILTDLNQYKKRLSLLPPSDRESCDELLLRQEGVLRAISM